MPDYHRASAPVATYFFTVNLRDHSSLAFTHAEPIAVRRPTASIHHLTLPLGATFKMPYLFQLSRLADKALHENVIAGYRCQWAPG